MKNIQAGDRVLHLGNIDGLRKNEVYLVHGYRDKPAILHAKSGKTIAVSGRFQLVDDDGSLFGAIPQWLRRLPPEETNGQTLSELMGNLNKVVA